MSLFDFHSHARAICSMTGISSQSRRSDSTESAGQSQGLGDHSSIENLHTRKTCFLPNKVYASPYGRHVCLCTLLAAHQVPQARQGPLSRFGGNVLGPLHPGDRGPIGVYGRIQSNEAAPQAAPNRWQSLQPVKKRLQCGMPLISLKLPRHGTGRYPLGLRGKRSAIK